MSLKNSTTEIGPPPPCTPASPVPDVRDDAIRNVLFRVISQSGKLPPTLQFGVLALLLFALVVLAGREVTIYMAAVVGLVVGMALIAFLVEPIIRGGRSAPKGVLVWPQDFNVTIEYHEDTPLQHEAWDDIRSYFVDVLLRQGGVVKCIPYTNPRTSSGRLYLAPIAQGNAKYGFSGLGFYVDDMPTENKQVVSMAWGISLSSLSDGLSPDEIRSGSRVTFKLLQYGQGATIPFRLEIGIKNGQWFGSGTVSYGLPPRNAVDTEPVCVNIATVTIGQ